MKVLIVCLLAVTFVSSAVVNQDKRRQIFGICAEMCGAGCPPGTVCESNGCGHTCQPITTPDACPCTCNDTPPFNILIG
ncbi:uncharacterized protein LOC131951119 isoform X5 [Physella acuta]|uniref:uncharacterized protein LOC131951119 isoform X5 n=1 Tax=Physella acuta TaxID=109671 RepID=UPI0027DCA7ED|nr:uncharacterized protein LOC131951119 isoform X5 [Physella acuta]